MHGGLPMPLNLRIEERVPATSGLWGQAQTPRGSFSRWSFLPAGVKLALHKLHRGSQVWIGAQCQ